VSRKFAYGHFGKPVHPKRRKSPAKSSGARNSSRKPPLQDRLGDGVSGGMRLGGGGEGNGRLGGEVEEGEGFLQVEADVRVSVT
jgi:hypothetical protein